MKIAGVDEVGIGCLAGPLVAAAVIIWKNKSEYFFKDSKKNYSKEQSYTSQVHKTKFLRRNRCGFTK